jgi:hypothetical protein
MSFTSEYGYEMEPWKEYRVILGKQQTEEEIYMVMARGYGIFEIDELEKGEKIYFWGMKVFLSTQRKHQN